MKTIKNSQSVQYLVNIYYSNRYIIDILVHYNVTYSFQTSNIVVIICKYFNDFRPCFMFLYKINIRFIYETYCQMSPYSEISV